MTGSKTLANLESPTVTRVEAAAILNCGISTIYKLRRMGKLKPIFRGSRTFYARAEVMQSASQNIFW